MEYILEISEIGIDGIWIPPMEVSELMITYHLARQAVTNGGSFLMTIALDVPSISSDLIIVRNLTHEPKMCKPMLKIPRPIQSQKKKIPRPILDLLPGIIAISVRQDRHHLHCIAQTAFSQVTVPASWPRQGGANGPCSRCHVPRQMMLCSGEKISLQSSRL